MDNKKPQKIYFNEEIDSRITGLALVFALLACGVLLQFSPIYFGSTTVTEVVKWIFLIVGVLGFILEASKTKSKIVGLDNIFLGIFLIAGWFVLFWFVNHWLTNTIAFVLFLIGAFGFFQGVQQVIYSMAIKNKSEHTNTLEDKQEHRMEIIMFLTKLLGIALVVIQIIKAVLDLRID